MNTMTTIMSSALSPISYCPCDTNKPFSTYSYYRENGHVGTLKHRYYEAKLRIRAQACSIKRNENDMAQLRRSLQLSHLQIYNLQQKRDAYFFKMNSSQYQLEVVQRERDEYKKKLEMIQGIVLPSSSSSATTSVININNDTATTTPSVSQVD